MAPPRRSSSTLPENQHSDDEARKKAYKSLACDDETWAKTIWQSSFDDDVLILQTVTGDAPPAPAAHFPHGFEKTSIPGDIHPILERENWLLEDGFVDNPDRVWREIQPALKIATKFLTMPQVLGPWLPIALGNRVHIKSSQIDHLELPPLADLFPPAPDANTADANAEARSAVHYMLKRLSGTITFTFGAIADTIHTHGTHFGPEQLINNIYLRGSTRRLAQHEHLHRIVVNAAYAEFLSQPRDADYQTEARRAQRVRTLFYLAVTLVHEIAHALCSRRFHDTKGTQYAEPRYDFDQPAPEMGSAVQDALFGVRINCTIHPRTGAKMEGVRVLSKRRLKKYVDTAPAVVFPIEDVWVQKFFTCRFWCRMRFMSAEEAEGGLKVQTEAGRWLGWDSNEKTWAWCVKGEEGERGSLEFWEKKEESQLKVKITKELYSKRPNPDIILANEPRKRKK